MRIASNTNDRFYATIYTIYNLDVPGYGRSTNKTGDKAQYQEPQGCRLTFYFNFKLNK